MAFLCHISLSTLSTVLTQYKRHERAMMLQTCPVQNLAYRTPKQHTLYP